MRKILTFFVVLVVGLLGLAVILPGMVDWNEYKGEIAAQVTKATGRNIFIGGDLKLSVLPVPTLSVEDLHLASVDGASDPDMVSLGTLDIQVALRPLLEGRIEVDSVVLVRPVINLELLADGRNNWTFAPKSALSDGGAAKSIPDPAPSQASQVTEASTEAGDGSSMSIILKSVTIEDGVVSYRDSAKNELERITGFNAVIAAETLEGPFEAEGRLTARGLPLSFNLKSGSLRKGQPIALGLGLGLSAGETAIKTSGTLALSDYGATSGPTFAGKVHVEGENLADLVGGVAARLGALSGNPLDLPGVLVQDFVIDGDVNLTPAKTTIGDLAFDLGGIKAAGRLHVVPGTPLAVDLALSVKHIDLDKALALPGKSYGGKGSDSAQESEESKKAAGAKSSTKSTAKPTASPPVKKAKKEDPLFPADIAAKLNLDIGALVYNGKVIQQGLVNLSLAGGKLKLDKVSAQLPGSSKLSLAGAVVGGKESLGFNGKIDAASDNLREFFNWLKIDVGSVPADRLRRMSFAGKVRASKSQVDVTGLNMLVDATRLKGGVAIALRKRPSFGIDLTVDTLNLDAYLSGNAGSGQTLTGAGGEETKAANSGQPAKPKSLEGGDKALLPALEFLNGFDANVKARIGKLTYNKMPVEGVRLDGTLQGGKLTLREAGVQNFAGAGLKINGTASGFSASPSANMAFDIQTKNLSQLFRLAGSTPPDFAGRTGKVALSGRLQGELKALKVDTGLDFAGGKVTLTGTLDKALSAPEFNFLVNATHPSFARMVQVFNPAFRPSLAKLGDFTFKGQLHGNAERFTLSGLKSKLGPAVLAGEGQISLEGKRPNFIATLNGNDILIDMFLPPKGKSLGLAPADNTPRIIPATYVAAAPRQAQPSRIPWSRDPINLTALAAIDADIKLASASLAYGKYRVIKPQLALKLKDAVLDVTQLTGTLFEGAFNMRARMMISDMPTIASTISVTNANVGKALLTAGNIDVAKGRLNTNFDLTTAGRNSYEMISRLSGKGKFNVTEGIVKGFDLTAISERLKHLDNLGSFLGLLDKSMSGGQTPFSRLDGTFVIDKGIAT
ncbi:MAG: AsmA family protein, partial [Rhodospirillaceae bacterium]|nr:AsmA family protein [Rhodospirillaceae bacterium]